MHDVRLSATLWSAGGALRHNLATVPPTPWTLKSPVESWGCARCDSRHASRDHHVRIEICGHSVDPMTIERRVEVRVDRSTSSWSSSANSSPTIHASTPSTARSPASPTSRRLGAADPADVDDVEASNLAVYRRRSRSSARRRAEFWRLVDRSALVSSDQLLEGGRFEWGAQVEALGSVASGLT